ncbi:hypothetical protein HZY97_01190 [Sphingomonas sp. R-74633]|uniref:hypothetical protein n=1 Tax=Sphingomonas sp. R-74633 TaxID=2751188 RepID=UPI0015D3EB9F|nr:hypothetical protein [Sphingomonas sp. R-74633]NYT39359.1 hypothetical protein [Sphingomonas sp. R-74633]
MMVHQLARTIANFYIALDFSEEDIHEDDVVKILENVAIDLLELDPESRKILSDAFRNIAPEYDVDFREYVETFPATIGIEEEEI